MKVRSAGIVVVAAGVGLLVAGCRSRFGGGPSEPHAPAPALAHAHEDADEHDDGHDDEHEHERPPPLCRDLRHGWCAPVEHVRESRRGTPYVHAFHAEPAFLGRDLLVHLEREGDERALEVELE